MKKNGRSVISTGTASLLCMLAFAVLSLVSARTNLRTSQKSADRTTAYYEAENKANDILLKISQTIEKNLDSENETVFYENVKTELDGKDGISFSDADKLDYPVEMAEQQFLCFCPLNHWKTESIIQLLPGKPVLTMNGIRIPLFLL